MERLTNYNNDCKREMICRYEDCDTCEEYCPDLNEDNCPCLQEALKKLAEYEDLEEQGKLLKLPCAVGDTVYQHMIVDVDKDKKKPIYAIYEAKIFKFSLDSYTLCFWTVDKEKHQNKLPLSAFGETVFITKEEAESALKELEEG